MSKAKYRRGDTIRSLDELMNQELVYCMTKVMHKGWFCSWPLRLADHYLKGGHLRYVVRKEGPEGGDQPKASN